MSSGRQQISSCQYVLKVIVEPRGVAGFQRECVKEQGVAQLAEVGACAVEGLSGLGGAGVGCSERRRLQMYNQK